MTTKPLPESLTREQFEQACDELREVLGQKRVYTDDVNELRSYRDVYATLPDEAHMPSAAVAPESVEEIQLILAVTRKYTSPLWTISTGKNFAYGGPAPRKAGFFVLDLKRHCEDKLYLFNRFRRRHQLINYDITEHIDITLVVCHIHCLPVMKLSRM